MKQVALVVGVLAFAALLYSSVIRQITRESRSAMTSPYPELEWLKREYSLSNEQFTLIEELHRAHDVKCKQYCLDLAKSQKELLNIIGNERVPSEVFQSAVGEWRKQRDRSQNAVLQHMYEVSSIMDPEKGKRYREHIYQTLILPGRTPHIDESGEFRARYIDHPR